MRTALAIGLAAVVAFVAYYLYSHRNQAASRVAMPAPVAAKPEAVTPPVEAPAVVAEPAQQPPESTPLAKPTTKRRVKRVAKAPSHVVRPRKVAPSPEPPAEPLPPPVATASEPVPAPVAEPEAAYVPPTTSQVLAAAVFGDDKYKRKTPAAPVERKVERYGDMDQAVAHIGRDLTANVPPDKSIAVADVVSMNTEARDNQLGAIASEMLTTKAIQAGGPKVAEKSQVTKVLGELEMSSLGLTQERDLTKAGLILGVDYMVAGSIRQDEHEAVLTITKVDTASGHTVATWEAHIPNAATQPLVDQYVEKRTKTDALYRSLLFPGWGQFYNGQDLKGGLYLGTGAALIGLTAFQYSRFLGAKAAYQAAGSETEAAAEFARSESLAGQTYVLLGVTGAFWLLNGLDAYIYGNDESRVKEGVNVNLGAPATGGYAFSLAYRW